MLNSPNNLALKPRLKRSLRHGLSGTTARHPLISLSLGALTCLLLSRLTGGAGAVVLLFLGSAMLLRAASVVHGEDAVVTSAAEADIANEIAADAEALRRKTAMIKMAELLEALLHAELGKIAEHAVDVRAIANTIATIAEKSGENIVSSGFAAENSVEASHALAASTTQMQSAISRIGQQMGQATMIARDASGAGNAARAAMGELTQQIASVASVTNRISALARQTNLLAMNAAIEAARAGTAGSGFGVVAAEVKALARQTAALTSEISQIIGKVGQVNNDATAKVNHMEQKITAIEAIASVIAQAVDEQRQVTTGMAANVQCSADAATDLSVRVESLTQSMLENLDQIASVHVQASAMMICADGLEAELKNAISNTIRSASPEINRRRHPRYVVSEQQLAGLNCRASLQGSTAAPRLTNLSDSGCRFTVHAANVPDGATGTLHFVGHGAPIPFRVVTQIKSDGCVTVFSQFTAGPIDAAALLGLETRRSVA